MCTLLLSLRPVVSKGIIMEISIGWLSATGNILMFYGVLWLVLIMFAFIRSNDSLIELLDGLIAFLTVFIFGWLFAFPVALIIDLFLFALRA